MYVALSQYTYVNPFVIHQNYLSFTTYVLLINDNIVRVYGTAFTVVCAKENSEIKRRRIFNVHETTCDVTVFSRLALCWEMTKANGKREVSNSRAQSINKCMLGIGTTCLFLAQQMVKPRFTFV